jgi:acyl carrier protein
MNEREARDILGDALHRIAPEVDIDTIDTAAQLQDEIDLDSINFLDLVTAIHERTGVDIPERDYALVTTFDDFVAYLASHAAV